MKITKRELKQMINESVREVLNEHGRGASLMSRTYDRFDGDETQINYIKKCLEFICNKLEKKTGVYEVVVETNVNKDAFGYYDWQVILRCSDLTEGAINAIKHFRYISVRDNYLEDDDDDLDYLNDDNKVLVLNSQANYRKSLQEFKMFVDRL